MFQRLARLEALLSAPTASTTMEDHLVSPDNSMPSPLSREGEMSLNYFHKSCLPHVKHRSYAGENTIQVAENTSRDDIESAGVREITAARASVDQEVNDTIVNSSTDTFQLHRLGYSQQSSLPTAMPVPQSHLPVISACKDRPSVSKPTTPFSPEHVTDHPPKDLNEAEESGVNSAEFVSSQNIGLHHRSLAYQSSTQSNLEYNGTYVGRADRRIAKP